MLGPGQTCREVGEQCPVTPPRPSTHSSAALPEPCDWCLPSPCDKAICCVPAHIDSHGEDMFWAVPNAMSVSCPAQLPVPAPARNSVDQQ